MSTHSISDKGWVVIPAELRKKYNLYPGAQVRIVDYGGVLAIVPALSNPVQQATGIIHSQKSLTMMLLEEHRRELDHE